MFREAILVKFTNGQRVTIYRESFTLAVGGKVVAKRVQVRLSKVTFNLT